MNLRWMGALAVGLIPIFGGQARAQRLDATVPMPPDTGGLPQMLIADLNGDHADDAVLHGNETYLALAGPAPGSANWSTVAGVPSGGRAAVADITGDGILDLVVVTTDGTSINVTVLPGVLSGSAFAFGAPVTASSPGSAPGMPDHLLVADVNGDLFPDIVVGMPSGGGYSTFEWMNVAGGFMPGGAAPIGAPSASLPPIALADVNGDGRLDLFSHQTGASPTVSLNTGGGNFGGPISLSLLPDALDPVIGDVDADGHPDIVEPTSTGVRISFTSGTGIGAQVNVTIPGLVSTTGLVAADLQNTGRLDIIVAGYDASGRALWVAWNLGSQTFQQVAGPAIPPSAPGDPALGSMKSAAGLRTPVTLTENGLGSPEILSAYVVAIGPPPPPPPPPVAVSVGPDFTAFVGSSLTAPVALSGTVLNGTSTTVSVWSEGTTVLGPGPSITITAGIGVHSYMFSAFDSSTNKLLASATVNVTVLLVQGLTTGPQGLQGPPGPTGPPGPPGTAVTGTLLFLIKGAMPPPGFNLVGSVRQQLVPGRHLDVDVYIKGPVPPPHKDADHDRVDKAKK